MWCYMMMMMMMMMMMIPCKSLATIFSLVSLRVSPSPGIPTTIKTMGFNITTIAYLRVLIIEIGSTIILVVVEAQGIFYSKGLKIIQKEPTILKIVAYADLPEKLPLTSTPFWGSTRPLLWQVAEENRNFRLRSVVEEGFTSDQPTSSNLGGKYISPIWMFPKIVGFPPKIIHFNRVLHYKSSIFGVPLFMETPIWILWDRSIRSIS